MRKHLEAVGLYGGESAHGFRRGPMQAAAAQGANRNDLGLQAQIKTAAVVERYISTTRHRPRLQGTRGVMLPCRVCKGSPYDLSDSMWPWVLVCYIH